MRPERRLAQIILMITVGVTLLGGLGAGLARLGWQMDSLSRNWMVVHGPLMISGFLGTLICLERAVALKSRFRLVMVVPVINALGAAALLLMQGAMPARILLVLGSAGLTVLFIIMLRIHPSQDIAIMTSGSASWLVGNILWLAGQPIFQVVHLWTAFLVLTIVGERLELSRVQRLGRANEHLLVLFVGIYQSGALLSVVYPDVGIRILGAGGVLMAIWLLRNDIARRTILKDGLPRYIAACLLSGYVWLGFGGAVSIWKGAVYAGPNYALILHALLLGFVFSMIFGHMPIILPALTGLRLQYRPIFYLQLVLLHVSLVYRTYGNLALNMSARRWGGLLNVATILLFLSTTVIGLILSNIGKEDRLRTHDVEI